VKKFSFKCSTNENSYFNKLFNKDDVKKILNDSRHSYLKENLMKIKLLIEVIETQEYKIILDKDKFEFSSKY